MLIFFKKRVINQSMVTYWINRSILTPPETEKQQL